MLVPGAKFPGTYEICLRWSVVNAVSDNVPSRCEGVHKRMSTTVLKTPTKKKPNVVGPQASGSLYQWEQFTIRPRVPKASKGDVPSVPKCEGILVSPEHPERARGAIVSRLMTDEQRVTDCDTVAEIDAMLSALHVGDDTV